MPAKRQLALEAIHIEQDLIGESVGLVGNLKLLLMKEFKDRFFGGKIISIIKFYQNE